MPAGEFDYLVCGSTPFAALLAGLLATAGGKRVGLLGEPWSPHRLPRRFDMSVGVMTRPDSWALLKRETPDVLKLLNGIGRGLFERVDPLFVAETAASTDRLGHLRWTAAGRGYAAERASERGLTETGSICRIRDAAMLVGGRIEPALAEWLGKSGIDQLPVRDATLATRRDGTATVTHDGRSREAATVVLADDDAILSHLAPSDRHRLLRIQPQASIVSEPASKGLPSALTVYLDRDVVIHQRAMKGPVTALAGGEPESVPARVGASIALLGPLHRTGQAAYRVVGTSDGAPLVGRSGRNRLTVIAGLGPPAAFLAPAIARYLTGTAGDDDRAYFDARDISKAAHRQSIAETEAPAPEATA